MGHWILLSFVQTWISRQCSCCLCPFRSAEARMICLVTGGRSYGNMLHVNHVLDEVHAILPITLLVNGAACTKDSKDPEYRGMWTGADWFSSCWARMRNVPLREFPVTPEEWRRIGPSAGPRRNQRMLDVAKPDLVIAFPGGRGTESMLKIARKAGVRIYEVADESDDTRPMERV